MPLPSNVDKFTARRVSTVTGPVRYVAYCADGFAFSTFKVAGEWRAVPSHAAAATDPRRFSGRTLGIVAGRVGASKRDTWNAAARAVDADSDVEA